MSINNAAQRRENIAELEIVRALCIIAVLCVHSSANAISAMKESHYYFFYNFMNIFMKYGTPTFIFLSSFILFYNYYELPMTKGRIAGFFKKRLQFILLPYIFFSVFYYIAAYYLNHRDLSAMEILHQFGRQLLLGKVFYHLYFVFINAQFYLFFPFALWLFKKVPSLLKGCIPIGLGLQCLFNLLNHKYLHVPSPGSWMLSYISYFLLGACLGSHFPKIKGWLIASRENATRSRVVFWVLVWSAWLAAALNHVSIYYQARLYGTHFHSMLYYCLWNAQTYLGAIVLIQIAFFISRHLSPTISSTLKGLGSLSFGIYLIHPFFMIVYQAFFPISTGNAMLVHLWYVSGFLFALGGSWLAVALTVRYVSLSWVIFGKSAVGKTRNEVSTLITQTE